MQKYQSQFDRMTQAPVKALVLKLAAPTIVSMLISALYNMADTFFVGKLGVAATGAVGVSFAVMAILQAVGFTFGMGSGNYISRLLGAQEKEQASRVASTGFFTALGVGVLLAVPGIFFAQPLAVALGADQAIQPVAAGYLRVLFIGAPYMVASFVLNNLLRFQGSAFYGMLGIGAGALLNILLDPLFIFVFGMGVPGAALATILSQLCGFGILLFTCRLGENLHISWKKFSPSTALYKEILKNGAPSFYRQGLASLSTIFLNFSAGAFGTAAIAAMSVVTRIMMFALSALLGFGQGFQPVCGFNYGAGKTARVLKAYWFCVRVSVIFLAVVSIGGAWFAPALVRIFQSDPETVRIGAAALRCQCLTFTLSSYVVLANMLTQTIGKTAAASLLAVARQGLFFLPALLVLPRLGGLTGLLWCQPTADALSFLLAAFLSIRVLRELYRRKKQENNCSYTT